MRDSVKRVGVSLCVLVCGGVMLLPACGGGSSSPSGTGGKGGTGGTGGAGAAGGSGGGAGGAIDGGPKLDGGGAAGSGPGTDGAASTPVAECQQFVTTFCNRLSTTCADPGGMPPDEAACNRQTRVAAGCDRATESFATCVTDLNAQTCATLAPPGGEVTLPPSCITVLGKIPVSEPQTKCRGLIRTACEREIRCGTTTLTVEMCGQEIESTQIPCAYVTMVGATYDQCLQEIKAWACTPSAADGGAPVDARPDGGADAAPPSPTPSCSRVLTVVQ